MNKHWTKLHSDVVFSERMADLMDRNPLAYALFMNAKAVCDHYGRLPASPRKFKGLAAPLTSFPPAKIEKAIEDMAACNVVRLYEADGDQYLEVCAYNDVDGTDWRNVGAPEYPAPEDWQPPVGLIQFIATASDGDGKRKSRVYPERYGINQEEFARWSAEYGLIIGRLSGDSRAIIGRGSESEAEAEAVKDSPLPPCGGQVCEPDAFSEDQTALPQTEHEYAAITLQENHELTATFLKLQESWGVRKAQQFTLDTAAAIADPEEVEITLQSVREWLATDGMRPRSTDAKAGVWLRRCRAILADQKRNGGGNSSRADPILTAFIAAQGPRPTDGQMGRVWDVKLEGYRQRETQGKSA